MMPAAGFVQVVVQIGAGGDETVDVPVGDEVGDDQTQAAGAQGPRHPKKDRHIVFQHLVPHTVRGRKVAALKRDSFHAARAGHLH